MTTLHVPGILRRQAMSIVRQSSSSWQKGRLYNGSIMQDDDFDDNVCWLLPLLFTSDEFLSLIAAGMSTKKNVAPSALLLTVVAYGRSGVEVTNKSQNMQQQKQQSSLSSLSLSSSSSSSSPSSRLMMMMMMQKR